MSNHGWDVLRALLGTEKLRLVDVGARDGISERWEPFHGLLQVMAFEPDPEECTRLNEHAPRMPYPVQFVPRAVGAEDGQQATLNICRQASCSSTLAPNEELCRDYHYAPNMEVVKTWPVKLHRLDSIGAEYGFRPDVVKIDTQGTGLDVLRGAGNMLQDMLIVELEVEFVSQYIDQSQACDVNVFMRDNGFVLRGLKRSYWRRTVREGWPQSTRGGQLLHGDVLYVSKKLDWHLSGASRMEVVKGLVALSAYQQDDLIIDLLSRPHPALSELSETDRRALAHLFTRQPPGGVRGLFSRLVAGAGYTNRRMRRWVDGMRAPVAVDWHDADFY